MGNSHQVFTEVELEEYQDCTFFTRKEVLHVYKRFSQLSDRVATDGRAVQLSQEEISDMPELMENPFKDRICAVFSDYGDGQLTFDNFLDLFSVFSEGAPRDVKAAYAFKIYDFDNDGWLGRHDIGCTIRCLTGEDHLTQREIDDVTNKVLEESDLDGDGRLSFVEFEHVISRAPDFINTFHIRI
ncbi:calcium and integrin-binding family member 2-like [Sycon ciliatum]|uniref:calcium and integrin-binding family member 2-like n=1 Tax=Sycon ciliatum TaxID=27933 RepID=UPI0020AE6072|eukprot:scpid18129/ scgid19359/ Calcium and integrin-binding family member 2; Kinase-interacting protein 2